MYRTLSRPTLAVLLTLTLVGSLVIGGGVVAQQSAVEHTEESPTQETTYLRVVHASPDAPAVDIYINESTMNDSVDNESMPTNDSVDNETSMNDSVDNESTLMNVTLTNVSFSNASEYLTLEAGTYNITITAAGDREAVVYEDTVTLDARTVTTLVASGEIAEDVTAGEVDENATDNDASENTTESDVDENATADNASANASTPFELVAYDDDALRPAANDSAIRIVHLSPDAPTVDVTTANGTVLADGLSFQESSGYMTVPAGDHEVQIRADTPDQNGTVVATVNVSVEAGTAYSAMALGYTNATEEQTPFEVTMTEDATRTVHIPSEAENETETN